MKCLAFAASAALVAAPVSAPATGPYAHDESLIVPVLCASGSGTAFKVGWNTYITADHVSDNEDCAIGGEPVLVTRRDLDHDFAMLRGPASPHSLPVSCAGFKAGKLYLARGHVPNAWFMSLPWVATEIRDPQRLFLGEAIPGMSGGAVLDRKGRAVGVVSKRLAARATDLRDTSVCP
jgi:hypothetical protein